VDGLFIYLFVLTRQRLDTGTLLSYVFRQCGRYSLLLYVLFNARIVREELEKETVRSANATGVHQGTSQPECVKPGR
jgi:hypothetical protein